APSYGTIPTTHSTDGPNEPTRRRLRCSEARRWFSGRSPPLGMGTTRWQSASSTTPSQRHALHPLRTRWFWRLTPRRTSITTAHGTRNVLVHFLRNRQPW